MNCQIIYYMARNTGIIETIIKEKLSMIDIDIVDANVAIDHSDFPDVVINSFESSDFIIICGGLSLEGNYNALAILKKMIDTSCEVYYNKISLSENYGIGYIVECGKQMILLLDDAPEVVRQTFDVITEYLCYYFDLKMTKKSDDAITIEKLSIDKLLEKKSCFNPGKHKSKTTKKPKNRFLLSETYEINNRVSSESTDSLNNSKTFEEDDINEKELFEIKDEPVVISKKIEDNTDKKIFEKITFNETEFKPVVQPSSLNNTEINDDKEYNNKTPSGTLVDDSCIIASPNKYQTTVKKLLYFSSGLLGIACAMGIVIWLLCVFDVITLNFLNW